METQGPEYDLVVVGAGWAGLAAAKIYLELHPSERILVIESATTCGGTWAEARLYPDLKSNNILGSYEYPDFPMTGAEYKVKHGQHIPAASLHAYLTDYAKRFNVFERTVFDTKVEAICKSPDGWEINTTSTTRGLWHLRSRRIILATGLTSEPNVLSFSEQDSFDAPIFHVKDFSLPAATIKTSESVVVVGGAKSAYDTAYAYAREGVTVDMVIRPDGKGPVWLAPPYVTPLRRKTESLLHTRLLSWFSPCPWGDEDGFAKVRALLHGTSIGRWIVRQFWHMLGSVVIHANGYDSHEETKKLKPWSSPFWTASGISINNYEQDVFRMVREGMIRVHIATITHLSSKTAHLSTGKALSADALICATGWKPDPPLSYLDFSPQPALPESELAALFTAADDAILSRFPALRNQPPNAPSTVPASAPLRLYRFMVPASTLATRSIAFAGAVSTVSTAVCAHVQALWISAYFDDALERTPASGADAAHEAVLHARWARWRYPCGYGPALPDLAFDVLPYFDLLVGDLGLERRRKRWWWEEVVAAYGPGEYRGLVGEYRGAQGQRPGGVGCGRR